MSELRIDLSSLPEDVREKLVAFLEALGINIEGTPIPHPKKKPIRFANKPVYMNIYTVEYAAERYEGSITQTYACYSVGAPIKEPEILAEHHRYFYPDHEILNVEWYGSYERPNIGRAKLVYDADTKEWVEVE